MIPWLAALALTFHPNVLNFTRQILSETLATALLVTAVYFALKGHPGWSGFFMGLCLLIPVPPHFSLRPFCLRLVQHEFLPNGVGALLEFPP
jgi:hypothetical protein